MLDPVVRERMRLNGWETMDYLERGEHVATGIHKGAELHVIVDQAWRGRALSRRRVREFLQPLFERHGYVSTRVAHERVEQQAFVERIGFKKTWEDAMFRYYMLTALPFERKVK